MKTILLAVSEPLDHLASAFDPAAFLAVVATNGFDAVARATERVFDLVVVDIALPDMDGVALLGRLYDLPGCRDLPAIVLVEHDWGPVLAAGRACPRASVMSKPVDPANLLAVVRALTGGGAG
jgi:CheY-like chemotaxis protein